MVEAVLAVRPLAALTRPVHLGTLAWGALVTLLATVLVQYGPLLRPRRKALPPGNAGWPLLVGHSFHLFGDVGTWLRAMHKKYGPAYRCLFFGTHVVVVDLDVYERALAKLDSTAQFVPLWPTGFQSVLGRNALQFLDAGSGQRGARHRRLKRKVLDALTASEIHAFLPRIEAIVREEFEEMVAETAASGSTALMPHTMRVVKKVILELILGPSGIRAEEYLKDTSSILMQGMIAAPVDIGSFSAYGRAMRVRRGYQRDVEKLVAATLQQAPAAEAAGPGANDRCSSKHRTLLSRLTSECKHGEGLSLAEMQDMLISLLFGGSLTTAETMQWLLVELSGNSRWFAEVQQEQRSLASKAVAAGGLMAAWGHPAPEGSRSPCPKSLAACYETLRLHCPVDVQLRTVEVPVDLGEGCGTLPAGWWVGVHLTERGLRQGPEFDLSRWEGRAAASEVSAFGLGPHFCVGRQLAIWELQVFLHVWLTEYEVDILNTAVYNLAGMKRFKDGLPVTVRRSSKKCQVAPDGTQGALRV